MQPAILHVDEHLLVIDKPSGLLAVPGRGPEKEDSVVTRLRPLFPDLRVVHRLDRDTSGVMVLARGESALRALGRQFQQREVDKTYVALAFGRVSCDAGRIALPLVRDFAHPPRYRVDYTWGWTAVTDYRVLVRQDQATRLELKPRTGRSHQLRVHLCQLGHPIVGDPLYASPAALAFGSRLCLHALSLTVQHPCGGRLVCWTAAAPF